MELEEIWARTEEFNKATHGSSDYDQDIIYVMGTDNKQYVPLSYLQKKTSNITKSQLYSMGFVHTAYDFMERGHFRPWYEKQFSKKVSTKMLKKMSVLYRPLHKDIFNALETVHKCYSILRQENILINNKNLPIQLGEWYAKCVFGLEQQKSTSQRGFDFELEGKRVEVKIHWNDISSPKGVKIKKSLIELSESCILLYISRNFMIRDICFLDSDFILRKFFTKGHTVFLKDSEIAGYFFSKSSKQFDKVVNKVALMTFASPQLALTLEGRL